MSRTQHARPQQSSDDYSRIRNAAINVADTYRRFERDLARLQREIHDASLAPEEKTRAIQSAAVGRSDRAEALRVIFSRITALDDTQQGGKDRP